MRAAELAHSARNDAAPPAGAAPAIEALWWARRGDWARAHEIVQADEEGRDAAWVHAYLHRVEGDASNARYWYRRAGRPVTADTLDAEWDAIAAALLGEG